MAATATSHGGSQRRSSGWIVFAFLVGAAVAVLLGEYGRLHAPSGQRVFSFFFSNTLTMKVWLATGGFALALVQLFTSLRFFDVIRWPRTAPAWVVPLHRWSGAIAVLLTLPVAYHCLWSLGFSDITTRRLIHSVAGCAFYGAFVAKMLLLRTERPWPFMPSSAAPAFWPGWVFAVAGGLTFSALVALWLTSSVWFFTTVGLRF